MKQRFSLLTSLVLTSFPFLTYAESEFAKSPTALPATFHCEGFAIEAGQRREMKADETFETGSTSAPLAEIDFHFRSSESQRMTLQMRAKSSPQGLQVAATYIDVAIEPLGKVDAAFSEKVYPSDPGGSFVVEKNFTSLKISLNCKSSLQRN